MFFKFRDNDYYIDISFVVTIVICVICACFLLRDFNTLNELTIKEYKKILNSEFSRDFENYNDYLVYKLNN